MRDWRLTTTAFLLATAWVVGLGPNLLRNADLTEGGGGWETFGRGFTIDGDTSHDRGGSLRCQCEELGQVSGALQTVELNQQEAAPIVIRGWSRAEGVTGVTSPHYSLYCDIEYTTDSRPGRVDLPGQCVTFDTGTHDWQFAERVVSPRAPIKSIRVYVLFRQRHTGTAWFDALFVGALWEGRLTGPPEQLAAFPEERIPARLAAAVRNAAARDMVVHIARINPRQPPLRVFVGEKELSPAGPPQRGAGVVHKVPWRFPPYFAERDLPDGSAGVSLRRFGGRDHVDLHSRSVDAAPCRYTLALPGDVAVAGLSLDTWDTESGELQGGTFADRVLLSVLHTPSASGDRITVMVRSTGDAQAQPSAQAARDRRPTAEQSRVRTQDGLELIVGPEGQVAAVLVDGKNVGPGDSTADGQRGEGVLLGGLRIRDLFGTADRIVRGGTRRAGSGLIQEARLPDVQVRTTTAFSARRDRIDVEVDLQDEIGRDRAFDLTFEVPLSEEGWTWWDDISSSRDLGDEQRIESSIYPWCTVGHAEQGIGLTIAIPPERPCAFSFAADVVQGRLTVRFPLALSPDTRPAGRARLGFSLFRTDPAWGFRDAARRYYAAFPATFRRTATKEGGWLFAFPTAELPNPEDYAYHEGGSAGWQLDEKLGILTCPYRIPTQRQIVFPSLPASDEEAMDWIVRKSKSLAPQQWVTRGPANADSTIARTGAHSLRLQCATVEEYVGARQDVQLDQDTAAPVVLSGWCRTREVTGETDNDFGLYADLWLGDGTRLHGQCVPFRPGTHDWEERSTRLAPGKPIKTVRLHVLMRRSHAGTAWIDDVCVRPAGAEGNRVGNPGFEQASAHAYYARMMLACAAHRPGGAPYIVRRDNVGADVRPKNPIYNVVYAVNCDPDLFSDRDDMLTVGRFELDTIESMLSREPGVDGVYLDSISGWVSRYPNFRREHFPYTGHPLGYDPDSGRPHALGWTHTYEFMAELRKRLRRKGKVVFPNIGRGRSLPFLYFVCDVIGLEGGLRVGDFEQRLNFYRTLAHQRPVLVMDYLEVIGRPTRHADGAGFERFWTWCTLYGAHPSIGRSCAEAFERFGDVYRRFREPLKLLGAAGWQPVTHARASGGVRIERFGGGAGRLFLVLRNPSEGPVRTEVRLDAAALGLQLGWHLADVLDGDHLPAAPLELDLGPEGLSILEVVGRPEQPPARE